MNEKIFLNLKLKCLLATEVYKVADFLFAVQKEGCVTYSPNNCKALHMPREAVELAIQTLIDLEVIDSPTKENNFWKFKINADSIKRYNDSSWDDINNAPVLRKATEVKFMNEKPPMKYEMVNMSAEEMMALMQKLQAQITAKAQLEKAQKNNDVEDGLPW